MGEPVTREGGCCSTLLLSGEERGGCAVGQNPGVSRTEQASCGTFSSQLTELWICLCSGCMCVLFLRRDAACVLG